MYSQHLALGQLGVARQSYLAGGEPGRQAGNP